MIFGSTGGRGGREKSHLLPVQAEERAADGQTRAAPDRLCGRHGSVEPVHAETAGPDGGRAAGQLVQVALALCGVLHVQEDPGGPVAQVRLTFV